MFIYTSIHSWKERIISLLNCESIDICFELKYTIFNGWWILQQNF